MTASIHIFQGSICKPHIARCSAGSLGLANPSAWMKQDVFQQVLKHFIDNMTVFEDQPGVLITDNHNSHITLVGVELAENHDLDLLALPPHCSHKLEPLDVGVFGAFKKCTAHFVMNGICHILGKHCLYIMLLNCLIKLLLNPAPWKILPSHSGGLEYFLHFRNVYRE